MLIRPPELLLEGNDLKLELPRHHHLRSSALRKLYRIARFSTKRASPVNLHDHALAVDIGDLEVE
jgi:hypothetical protein